MLNKKSLLLGSQYADLQVTNYRNSTFYLINQNTNELIYIFSGIMSMTLSVPMNVPLLAKRGTRTRAPEGGSLAILDSSGIQVLEEEFFEGYAVFMVVKRHASITVSAD
nr:MAG TPA: hypothetical protein [Caudoviricetes sp.]